MPCLCITNTLRLFVRSIAQVDVVSSRTSWRHLQRTGVRSFTSIRTPTQQHAIPSILSTTQQPLGVSASDSQDGTGNTSNFHDPADAIAELSLESIEAIAAESRLQNTSPYGTVVKEKPASTREKELEKSNEFSRTTFRRTKVENTGFALHFSAPRAPPKDPPTKERVSGIISRTSARPESISTLLQERQRDQHEDGWEPPPREQWQINKAALKEKFPDGWNPKKRLSPDALAGIRALHVQMPQVYTTAALAGNFKVSPEAIRRILKSNWSPNANEEADRHRRWFERGKKIYTEFAEKGGKPPKPWRELGIGDGKPEWLLRKQRARAPLPALITTARKLEARRREREEAESSSLADRIL